MVLTLLVDYVLANVHVSDIYKLKNNVNCAHWCVPTCISVSDISCSLLSSVDRFVAAAILPSQSTQSLSESDWPRQTHQHSPPLLPGLHGGFILVPLKADGLVNKVPKAFVRSDHISHFSKKKKKCSPGIWFYSLRHKCLSRSKINQSELTAATVSTRYHLIPLIKKTAVKARAQKINQRERNAFCVIPSKSP